MTGAERLLAACRGQPVDTTPVWFMRQAGGSLPRYLALRERHDVMTIATTPALCAEVSAGAADVLGTDGAVLFADIMLPVRALGLDVELTAEGPRIERPIRTEQDVEALRAVDVDADLGFVPEAIRLTRAALGDQAAVIGIAGGPFTLAAYALEGGPSRDQLAARRVAHAQPSLWIGLLDRLTDVSVRYVQAQVGAGAPVIQVFDSWAGSLARRDYEALVAPWASRIIAAARDAGAAVIHHVAAGGHHGSSLALGAHVVGVDHTRSLVEAAAAHRGLSVQGNLDPARLAASWPLVEQAVDAVLDDARSAGAPGHVFNTGQAAPRDTPPERLRAIVERVHERGARSSPSPASVRRAPPSEVPA
jgi:uroporphyrinogen decarboxylase